MRRLFALLLPVVLLVTGLPIASAAAAGATVTGSVVSRDKSALGAGATAVVILVDQQSGATGGSVIAVQRVDNAQWPVKFAVPYDAAAIDPTHSYALYATVVDGAKTYQTLLPTPVITGGPTADVVLTALPPLATATSSLPGTITRDDKSALTPAAVAIAALVREDTGTVEAYQIIPGIKTEPISFKIAFDPGLIDPAASYVVRGGIVDGSRSWTVPAPVPAISAGVPVASVSLKVVLSGPSASPTPTAPPKPTPTAKPTQSAKPTPTAPPKPTPTAKPSATPTPKPSPTPTAAPSATATAAPTATPSPSPTQTPTPTPSPTPSPTPTPQITASSTPEPSSGTVSGTVTWDEGHIPSADARLLVSLVDASGGDRAGQVLASSSMTDPGKKPVAFTLTYPREGLVAGDHYRIVAILLDGELAWINQDGVKVPVPDPAISDVVVPLTFAPDLLKAQVSGIVTGDGLDGSANPNSYTTVVLVNRGTGQLLGYDAVAPIGASPVAFAIPYSLAAVSPGADLVVNATAWDGTRLWTTASPPAVITNGNPKIGVAVPLTAGPAPSPRPTDAPIIVNPSFPPGPSQTGDGGIGFFGFILLLAAVTAGTALLAWSVMELRARGRRGR